MHMSTAACVLMLAAACLLPSVSATQGVQVNKASVNVVELQTTTVRITLALETRDKVTIQFESEDESWIIINPKEMIFEAGDWDKTQDLTIQAHGDSVELGNRDVRIRCKSVTSLDDYYNDWDETTFGVNVKVIEDDVASIKISGAETDTHEDGSVDGKFLMALSQPPVSDVTMTIVVEPAGEATVLPAEMVLTTGGYSKMVAVRSINNDIDDGDREYKVVVKLKQNADANGHDPFNNMQSSPITFVNIDDDEAGLSIKQNEEGTAVVTYEADTTSITKFAVRLNSLPKEPVTLTYEVDENGRGEGKIWRNEDIINPTNDWRKYRESGVFALDDGRAQPPNYEAYDDDKNYTVTVRAESADPKYQGVQEKLVVTNIDNDGLNKMRFIITKTRGQVEEPEEHPEGHLDLNELRLSSKWLIPIDLSDATAICFQTETMFDCPLREDCGLTDSCGVQNAIDDNLEYEWRTSGKVTMEITFRQPKTVCHHALVWGSGTGESNPYRWEIAGQWEGDDRWTRFYEHTRDIPRTAPKVQSPWYSICRSAFNSLKEIDTFVDPPVGGYKTPAPPTPEPSTERPAPGDSNGGTAAPSTREPPTLEPLQAAAAPEDDDDMLLTWLIVGLGLLLLICGLLVIYFLKWGKKQQKLPPTPEPVTRDAPLYMQPEDHPPPPLAYAPPPQPPPQPLYAPQPMPEPEFEPEPDTFGSVVGSMQSSPMQTGPSMMGGALGTRGGGYRDFTTLPPQRSQSRRTIGRPGPASPTTLPDRYTTGSPRHSNRMKPW
eukprot:TRINITY_DN4052_c0_g1_i1.p1 TRINITY_DN4052_c0_g1~~TRINITY_DN4052_c0_g1_i1.p1  ORF type:complete len:775 (+),score=173.49 TRINITY_DN4052_c0_g1_i1:58-2382(+)